MILAWSVQKIVQTNNKTYNSFVEKNSNQQIISFWQWTRSSIVSRVLCFARVILWKVRHYGAQVISISFCSWRRNHPPGHLYIYILMRKIDGAHFTIEFLWFPVDWDGCLARGFAWTSCFSTWHYPDLPRKTIHYLAGRLLGFIISESMPFFF